MPDYSWGCDRCKTMNPTYTEVCRDCGLEYRNTAHGNEAQALQEKKELNNRQIVAQRVAISPSPSDQPLELTAHQEENEHSDKRLLKYFFWFSLVLSSLLALVVPSLATIGIVATVIGLGKPLFSTPKKGKSTPPDNSSAYGVNISRPWWLFIAFSTLATPFVFGWTFGKDLAFFFILAFLGLTIATIVLMVAKLSSHSER